MKKILVITALLAACAVAAAQTKAGVDYKESSARNIEPVHSVMILPLIADLEVIGSRISFTETEAFSQYSVTPELVKYVPDFKKVALSRAAKAHGADAIIGATVDVITNSSGRLEITITGYPAVYRNFRNATLEEINIVQSGMAVMSGRESDVLTKPESQTKFEIEK